MTISKTGVKCPSLYCCVELNTAMAVSAQGELKEEKMVTIKASSENIGTVPICTASAQHSANAL